MKAAAGVEAGYVDAVARLFKRIEPLLEGVDDKLLPLGVYIAGGAAAFFHAGSQASRDIDASFSLRVQLPDDLEETYIDRDGSPASVYLDPRYNDTLGPLHEDALQDAEPLELSGIDRHKLDIRVLAPVDLAISKLGRFDANDRDDVVAMARAGLLDANAFKQRALEALDYHVGHPGGAARESQGRGQAHPCQHAGDQARAPLAPNTLNQRQQLATLVRSAAFTVAASSGAQQVFSFASRSLVALKNGIESRV